jgi:cyclase
MRDYEVPRRVIPCLDVHDGRVVKGEQFVNLRDAGDPVDLARHYETSGADELVFLDITATREKRETTTEIARKVAESVFIPFAIGGGVRSVEDAQALLDSGADKVAVNSAAIERPQLLAELANHVGRQSTILSVDAKRSEDGTTWEAYLAGGTKPSGKDAIAWAKEGAELGAGEILLTSIDRDGENEGYDIELLQKVAGVVKVPVIASGGAGRVEHFSEAIQEGMADAVLCASTLHRGELDIEEIKRYLTEAGIIVRPIDQRTRDSRLSAENKQPRPRLAIVDYGMGNRTSVTSALKFAGAEALTTDDMEEITSADGIVLPGVGAFPTAIERLRERNLISALNKARVLGKPILGICLGYQLLFESSEEYTETQGLGWIAGKVSEIDTIPSPNIGWRFVNLESSSALTQHLAAEDLFYHAHQFAAKPSNLSTVKGVSRLGGTVEGQVSSAASVVQDQNIFGTQFHPEKSSYSGLDLLSNFVNICRSANE